MPTCLYKQKFQYIFLGPPVNPDLFQNWLLPRDLFPEVCRGSFLLLLSLPCSVTIESWLCTVPVVFVLSCAGPRALQSLSRLCLQLQGSSSQCTAATLRPGQEGATSNFSLTLCRSWSFPTGFGASRMDYRTRWLCPWWFLLRKPWGFLLALDPGVVCHPCPVVSFSLSLG